MKRILSFSLGHLGKIFEEYEKLALKIKANRADWICHCCMSAQKRTIATTNPLVLFDPHNVMETVTLTLCSV